MNLTALSELFQKKQNFSSYRTIRERELLGADTQASSLVRQLEAVQMERKEFLINSDYRIGQLKIQIAQLGVPVTKTERKRWVDAQIRDEKAAIDQAFSLEVKARLDSGSVVQDLVKECGSKSPSIFYNATKSLSSETVVESYAAPAPEFNADIEWEYSDHRPVHRYAFNPERTLVKLHGVHEDDDSVVLTYPQKTYYSGDRSLEDSFHEGRAAMLLNILSGKFDGELRPESNKYNK